MTSTTILDAHTADTYRVPPAPGSAATYGWRCSARGCPAERDGYFDLSPAARDAADHEQLHAASLLPSGALAVAIGPGGSGKSRFASRFPRSWVVCLDELRERVSDDAGDQASTPDAVALQDLLIEARLARGRTTFVDSTNSEPRVRAGLLERARRHNRLAVAVVFLTPLETCLSRNSLRPHTRRVPSSVLIRQRDAATAALPRLADEGFSSITTVGSPTG